MINSRQIIFYTRTDHLLVNAYAEILVKSMVLKVPSWDFPGSPVAKTPFPSAVGLGLIPGQGTRSHMLQIKIPYSMTKTQEVNKL